MLMVHLKKQGVTLSRLGFGCMRFPTGKGGAIDQEKTEEMIRYALENGVNYFDTAFNYHGATSEIAVGKALKGVPRDRFFIADKLPLWELERGRSFEEIFSLQLERLGMDHVDFYLVHSLDKNRWKYMREHNIYDKLVEKRKQGKLRFICFSYHGDFETFCEIVDTYEWDMVQLQMNYLDDIMLNSRAWYEKLCEKQIPCFVMEPVRGGYLASPPQAVLDEMAAFDGGKTGPAAWALRWCMDKENMPVILSGMSTMEQLRENIETFSRPENAKLSPGEAALIDRMRDILLGIKSIPCTACRYCMDCSFGVDIPKLFQVYNIYTLTKQKFQAMTAYDEMKGAGHSADRCTACGTCAPMCPQGIDIPARLAEVHEVLDNITM